jgi:hypothetical protein
MDPFFTCLSRRTKSLLGNLSPDSAKKIGGENFFVTQVMPVAEENSRLELFHDENFGTVPDWRFPENENFWWPVGVEGALITGMVERE